MSELYDQIVQQRGSLEKLVASIPGFRGYQDKQARRTADRMLRDHIAEQVEQRIERLIRIEQLILDNGGMAFMSRTRRVKSKLQQFHDKIATAAPGYAGMWSQMKIGPDELEKVYSFDEALVRYLEKFDAELDKLEAAATNQDELSAAILEAEKVGAEAVDAVDLRDDVLTNLSKSV
jgi:hypothetical protein